MNTYWSYGSSRVKCLLRNSSVLPLFIKGRPFDDLELGLKYEWEVVQTNMKSLVWDFGNGTLSKNKTVVFNADREGNRKICVNVSVMGWFNKSSCFQVTVKKPLNLSRDTNEIVRFSSDVLVSPEDEIINGENFGKLLKIGSQIWISKDVPIKKSTGSLAYQCPLGYR